MGGLLVDSVRIDRGHVSDGDLETLSLSYGGRLDFKESSFPVGSWTITSGTASLQSNYLRVLRVDLLWVAERLLESRILIFTG